MDKIGLIKSEIERLYKEDPNIHISLKFNRPRLVIEDMPARIVGIYRNIFQIEESEGGRHTCHSLQYGDVLTGHVTIKELEKVYLENK